MELSAVSRASEQNHWYDVNGEPRYTVIGANGVRRASTLRDARKNGWLPSVTSIIKSAAAPGLERWKSMQVLLAAMTLPRLPDEPESDWMSRVMHDSREQARLASERGKSLHAAIEAFYQHKPWSEHQAAVIGANEAINERFGTVSWTAESSFAHELGFGGKSDLWNSDAVLDIKTKEFDENTKLDTYDEHCIQLAAYRKGLGVPDARCAIVYVSATVPGLARVIELEASELSNGWQMFLGLLQYWMAKNSYWPCKLRAA